MANIISLAILPSRAPQSKSALRYEGDFSRFRYPHPYPTLPRENWMRLCQKWVALKSVFALRHWYGLAHLCPQPGICGWNADAMHEQPSGA